MRENLGDKREQSGTLWCKGSDIHEWVNYQQAHSGCWWLGM